MALWCNDWNYTIGGDAFVVEETIHYACVDLNECALLGINFCAPNSDCTNTVGSALCMCLDGFDGK
jgi:hypothetical protein